QQGLVLREVSVIEDEDKLRAFLEALDRMRHAGRDEPDVAHIEIVDVHMPAGIDDREPCLTGRDVGPLGLFSQCSSRTTPGPRSMFTIANSIIAGISRTVTSRAQPPSSRRLWANAKKCRFGIEPWSVSGAAKMSGTCASRGMLRGPATVAPRLPLMGCAT